jgi:hypothetical protein
MITFNLSLRIIFIAFAFVLLHYIIIAINVTTKVIEEQITGYQAVNAFLLSISRNSRNSKYVYQCGLTHFQKFLKTKHPQYNIENIIKPLSNNELDIYVSTRL